MTTLLYEMQKLPQNMLTAGTLTLTSIELLRAGINSKHDLCRSRVLLQQGNTTHFYYEPATEAQLEKSAWMYTTYYRE